MVIIREADCPVHGTPKQPLPVASALQATPEKVGRKKELPPELSKAITNAACNDAGGPYALSKIIKLPHPHLSRCRTGEAQISKQAARSMLRYLRTQLHPQTIPLLKQLQAI